MTEGSSCNNRETAGAPTAMVMTVAWLKAVLSAVCSALSVAASSADVASSMTRSDERRSTARATQNSCRCPALKLLPPSPTSLSVGREDEWRRWGRTGRRRRGREENGEKGKVRRRNYRMRTESRIKDKQI